MSEIRSIYDAEAKDEPYAKVMKFSFDQAAVREALGHAGLGILPKPGRAAYNCTSVVLDAHGCAVVTVKASGSVPRCSR